MKQGLAAIFSFLALISIAFAIPQVISFDGYLTNASGSPLNGSYSFVFSIYNQTPGGTALWTETQTLAVSSGRFNALLGSVNALNLAFDQDYYLGVKVGTDSEMAPRHRVASSAYAYAAKSLVPGANASGDLYISGRVGVGTTAPSGRLDVYGGSSVSDALWVRSSPSVADQGGVIQHQSSLYGIRQLVQGTGSTTGYLKFDYINTTNISQIIKDNLFVIKGDGNIGIGTTSPASKLHIAGNSTGDGIHLSIANDDLTANNGMWLFFRGMDSAGYPSNYAGIRTKMISHTSGSQNAQLEFYVVNAAGSIASSKLTIAQNGAVTIPGTLSKGGGSFLIDDPLDPQNKILQHSFVESPDMKNIYDGTVSLNSNGEAVVELPAYFEALNKDFRYQLTPIGASMPNLFVKQKISQNRFTISGGAPGGEVSWQVTGTRKDAFAEKNRIIVEQEKGVGNDYKKGECIHKEACE